MAHMNPVFLQLIIHMALYSSILILFHFVWSGQTSSVFLYDSYALKFENKRHCHLMPHLILDAH